MLFLVNHTKKNVFPMIKELVRL